LIFNIGDFMVVFVVTFFVSFIPVIGAGPVALVLALYKLLLGDYGDAIGLGVVGIIAGTVDNLVRPYLISSNEGDLHPIVSLLAIIGALVIFGMPGLLLGPVIASVAVKIIPTLYAGPTVDAKDLGKKST
jgi:predicted PurR-regulated permease PerM